VVVIGIVVAALLALLASSVYYALATPLERRVVGAGAVDRGRPRPVKVVAELLRTAVVAVVIAWLADRADLLQLPGTLVLAAALWAGFPLVLLSGSVLWERVHPATAAMHAGDWLLKLVLVALAIGLLH
jgi:hypothetical protein